MWCAREPATASLSFDISPADHLTMYHVYDDLARACHILNELSEQNALNHTMAGTLASQAQLLKVYLAPRCSVAEHSCMQVILVSSP